MGFDEKHLVEDYIIKQLKEKGWSFVSADTLERESYEEPLLIPILVGALQRINKALNELKLTGTGIEGTKRILICKKTSGDGDFRNIWE